MGKKVGGGGVIAKRPPPRPTGSRAGGDSQASKQGLIIDTASNQSKQQAASVNTSNNFDGVTPRQQQHSAKGSQAPAVQRSGGDDSQAAKSRIGDDGIATPRNLEDNKNQPGSGGMLPEAKRSMDGIVTGKKTADSKELL